MADQGLLGQAKPAATTNTVLYSAPVNESASAVLTIANDGTGAAYDVGIKDYDQKLTLDASTYKLHKGDIISNYRVTVGTAITTANAITPGTLLTSSDGEKTFRFESNYVPATTSVFVKDVSIRIISIESLSGTFAVGDTVTKGTSPNQTSAVVYEVAEGQIYIGPSTASGTNALPADEFAAGDSVTNGTATATISTGGIGTAEEEFVFSTTTAGGTYDLALNGGLTLFGDRTYRFDVSDSSMSGRDFSLSEVVNGEWGPDNTAGNSDDGTEFTTGRTASGTAGSSNAYVQYDFGSYDTTPSTLYFYDGGTGTASNANYGGSDRSIQISDTYEYTEFYIYDKDGTWVNNTDTFEEGGVTYTVTAQTAGPFGYVRDYSGTTLTVVKGVGSADFAGSDTFQDVPKQSDGTRTLATVSSVDVATTALEGANYLTKDKTNAANNVDRLTSLVIGPGERLIVESATQNNVFSLIGFQDASTAFPTRVYG